MEIFTHEKQNTAQVGALDVAQAAQLSGIQQNVLDSARPVLYLPQLRFCGNGCFTGAFVGFFCTVPETIANT